MKRNRIWLLASELTLICILVGCESPQWQPNRENLKLVEVGMTKAEVLEIMGEPRERAAYSNSEWLVYQTDRKNESIGRGNTRMRPVNEWLTVLLLRDGTLAGTDRNYWKNRYKYRVLTYPLRY
ncbi:MAG: outer membrane protein assembly factor BamE domain-containing protein [Planctomycetota bacterium]